MRTNHTVKLFRDAAPSGLGSDTTLELVDSRVRCWLAFRRSTTITGEGIEVVSDGNARFSKFWDVQNGDVIELQKNPEKRYRLESVDEIYSASGTIVAFSCTLVRDSSVE